ncbi:MAG: T9SS type A sorting domain-containing protein [Ignavibacteriales bacterium]|nr:T9SS type A sorting domain-containing protein [Ignavibacteriales bacterium]HOJ07608.1 T9SS type A sorting domain-containing protein [Ignavibacteriaceae bacterium]
MKKKFYNSNLSIIVFFIALVVNVKAQNPCPRYYDLLNKGWGHLGTNPHNPQSGNLDEFAATDPSPFIIKAGNYPPVKSFPMIPVSGCSGVIYYFSFDTDLNYYPINYRVPMQQVSLVKTYRVDQNNSYLSGYSMSIKSPESNDIGGADAPDFVMKYNGTYHDVAWNINQYPWQNFVYNQGPYTPQGLTVNIIGVNTLSYNSSSEFIADINGGGGKYAITWFVKTNPNGNWVQVQSYPQPQNYYNIYGNQYYFYDNEYKYNLTMPAVQSVELKVVVEDLETNIEIFATKTISSNPEPVTFINHIETSENFGSLILNEIHSDSIASGDHRDLVYSTPYTIRTNVLPFAVNWNSTGKTEKQHLWEFTSPILYGLNRDFTFNPNIERTMKSKFLSTEKCSIKAFVDGVEFAGLDFDFKDPWFYYSNNGNWYQSDVFKPYTYPFNLDNSATQSYGGVFLLQEVSPTSPYYSIRSPLSLTKNQRTYFFQNWVANSNASLQQVGSNPTGYDQKAVVFTGTNALINANYKGHLMSGSTNGISSGSQRKMVRTDIGIYHLVYESMGNVYYTHSLTSNFDGSWSQEELLMTNAKNPAIEYHSNKVKIVFEFYDSEYSTDAILYLITYEPNASGMYSQVANECEEVAYIPLSYFGNAKPVISYNQAQLFIVYRKNTTEGLKERTKWFNVNTGLWNWSNEAAIPGTNSYSINPSVIESYAHIHLAYESQNSIMYKYAVTESYSGPWQYDAALNVSTGSGFNINRNPNISIAGSNNYVMISWTGIYTSAMDKVIAKEQVDGLRRYAAVVKAGLRSSWGGFSSFSNNVNFTNNNSINSYPASIIAWSESNGSYSKYVKRNSDGTYGTITNLTSNGIQPMVSNAGDFSNIEVMVFNTSTSAPYLLNKCTNNFAQVPLTKTGETETIDISYGRSGVVEKNNVEFLFNIGAVLLDGQTIKFVERIDTLPVTSIEELNTFARTESFSLNPQSELIFSNYYYVVNKNLADSLLADEFNVSFKCELVNSLTNQVIGTFDNVTYSKINVSEYNNAAYLVDCSGIESGSYYLRLFTIANEDVNLFISDIQRDDLELEKSNLLVRGFKGDGIPTTYELAQNFPNPFNPSTTIHYQIPQDGIITLKIYEILGNEVATLVNEEKIAGRYEVNFNTNNLASGVYIYNIQSGSYINSKKMILIK